MPAPSLAELKEQCARSFSAFLVEAEATRALLAAIELPIDRELRGALLQQLMVEHEAHDFYRTERQKLFQYVQEHFRRG